MLLIDYCKKHNRTKAYLIGLAQEGKLPSAKKVLIERTETGRNGKPYTKKRPMWIIEDEEAVTKYIKKRAENSKKAGRTRDGWTKASLECFKVRLTCHKCSNYEVCMRIKSDLHLPRPPIKDITIKLFKKYGRPPERIFENE